MVCRCTNSYECVAIMHWNQVRRSECVNGLWHRCCAVANRSTAASPQLAFRKWGFPDQNQIFDFVPAGVITDNRFDQFCVASMTGGYQAQVRPWSFDFAQREKLIFLAAIQVRPVAPSFTRLITIGADPYCNFYYCADVNKSMLVSALSLMVISIHPRALKCRIWPRWHSHLLARRKVTLHLQWGTVDWILRWSPTLHRYFYSRWTPFKQAATNTEPQKPKIEPETKLDSR